MPISRLAFFDSKANAEQIKIEAALNAPSPISSLSDLLDIGTNMMVT